MACIDIRSMVVVVMYCKHTVTCDLPRAYFRVLHVKAITDVVWVDTKSIVLRK